MASNHSLYRPTPQLAQARSVKSVPQAANRHLFIRAISSSHPPSAAPAASATAYPAISPTVISNRTAKPVAYPAAVSAAIAFPQVPQTDVASPPINSTDGLAYELVQGALVRWSDSAEVATAGSRPRRSPPPPTAVLLHGILGSRKNWGSFAKRLATEFPSWQFLLIDLRCHGDSTPFTSHMPPHSVQSAAADVLQLLRRLRITPRVLIGHSFGGKVALSMTDQAAKPMPWPIQVWVLDATPGTVRAGGDGEDHPAHLIDALRRLPGTIYDRKEVVSALCAQGFSKPVSQWMTTNLKKTPSADISNAPSLSSSPNSNGRGEGFTWTFDLDGVSDMYRSYEDTNMWPIVDAVPTGFHINFLRAERSLHRWAREDVARIHAAEATASVDAGGVQMHVLEDAGHWVHTDNPDGLFKLLAPTFGGKGFTH